MKILLNIIILIFNSNFFFFFSENNLFLKKRFYLYCFRKMLMHIANFYKLIALISKKKIANDLKICKFIKIRY